MICRVFRGGIIRLCIIKASLRMLRFILQVISAHFTLTGNQTDLISKYFLAIFISTGVMTFLYALSSVVSISAC